jgi:hypothetical protein
MKKYLSGSWSIIKNYFFGMIFFFLFFVGLYSKASLYSIAIFIVMGSLIYFELVHYAGFDKRRYGSIRPYEGAIYGLLAVLPFVIIQIILSQLNLHIDQVDFATLKLSMIKGIAAPMLFILKAIGYSNPWSYVAAWSSIVIIAFLGYYSGFKNFDLDAYLRRLVGLQPKQKNTNKKDRRVR